MAIDEVFAGAAQHDLARYGDLRIFFKPDGALLLVSVIENYRDAGFCYARLSALVYQILSETLHASVPAIASSGGELAHTWRFCARTVLIFVIPSTKHIASKILDFPLPLSPVMELKLSSLSKS